LGGGEAGGEARGEAREEAGGEAGGEAGEEAGEEQKGSRSYFCRDARTVRPAEFAIRQRMINGIDKTSFSPNSNNKTTSVAGIYQSIIQPYYLIKSMRFWSNFMR
jgi:hypothetical protein